jgi:hypothetical protein
VAAVAIAFPGSRSGHRVPVRRATALPDIIAINDRLQEESPKPVAIRGNLHRTVLVRMTTQSGDLLTGSDIPFFRVAFGEDGTSVQANHYPLDQFVKAAMDQKRWLIEGILPPKDV